MYSLQTSVIVDGREFTITNKGDFRMVLDCMAALRDDELSEDCRVLASLLIFYNEFDSFESIYKETPETLTELLKGMFFFIDCGQDESYGAKTSHALVDWEKDSQMICSAINKIANTEIRALDYLHWWTFMGYFAAIGDSTLATVVGIRNKLITGKKLEKWEQEFKRNNPNYFIWKSTTVEERETDKLIREIWNSGGKEDAN